MDRRRFLLTALVGVLAAPHAAEAQPTGHPRVAMLDVSAPDTARLAWGMRSASKCGSWVTSTVRT